MAAFDETFDWVVVGSGGGSMCSALVMRQSGKSAVILEKLPMIGGTTCRSGGVMWIPDNRFMKRDGVPDSTEQATTYLDSLAGDDFDAPGISRERRLAYVAEAPKMVDFLVGQGIRLNRVSFWPDYYDELPGGLKTSRTVVAELFDIRELGSWSKRLQPGFLPVPIKLEEAIKLPFYRKSWAIKKILLRIAVRTILSKLGGKRLVAAGMALQGQMLRASLEAGVDIRPESPVSELVVENDAVTGVVTVKGGRPWRIGARLGVLVNAGGFARNQQMRDKYQPGARTEWSQTCEGDTGEMLLEMERHGGVLAQMEESVGYQSTLAPGWEKMFPHPPVQSLTAKPHAILVDQSGVRYLAEGGSYHLYCKTMFQRNRTVPAIPSWAIFDSQYMANYMLAGTMPGSRKPRSWTEKGYLRQADSIAGLACQLNIDVAVLEATISRWNDFVDKGVDEDFHRGERAYDDWLGDPFRGRSKSLGKIDKAPFYAVPVTPGDVSTYGGVVTDVHARVLRADGTPIRGLYATGVSTASVMGRVYPGAGSSIGPSFTFGYVAARHAARIAD